MAKDIHDRAALKIAKNLENEGYVVETEPSPESIPFDMKGYRPDIIAVRGEEKLIIEVKTRSGSRNLERYKEIADAISKNPGWRFMLTTVNPDDLDDRSDLSGLPSAAEIKQLMKKLSLLIESGNHEFAIPYLWNALMAGMRIKAFHSAVPVDSNSDLRVINYMYSLGRLSHEDYQTVRSYHDLRNRAAHHLSIAVSAEEIRQFEAFLNKKLVEWGVIEENVHHQIDAPDA